MTPRRKRERAKRIREVAVQFEPEVARTMIALAEALEAEADSEEPRNEPPLAAMKGPATAEPWRTRTGAKPVRGLSARPSG
jgi:hypothetical protein